MLQICSAVTKEKKKRKKKKEVMDLTNRGLYFTTVRSASAPQTEMLSHLHSIQARTEQGAEQIQKKKKKKR